MRQPPASNELEVSVFGPGFGECVAVHLGRGEWAVFDSCIRVGATEPTLLEYFARWPESTQKVVLVCVTHWHDDHIRGVGELISSFPEAAICMSSAFKTDEFQTFLGAQHSWEKPEHGTGVDEMYEVVRAFRDKTRPFPRFGIADKIVWRQTVEEGGPVADLEICALSPSDFQVSESLARFVSLTPGPKKTKRRAVPEGENHHSTAFWIKCGDENIILGSDLEETADARAGWKAVVASTTRPNGIVSLLKVPHHGSVTGHSDELWSEVLKINAHAIVTPWNRSSGLPTQSDIDRLQALTENLHITSDPKNLTRVRHGHQIEKLKRDFGIRTYRLPSSNGVVTARKVANDGADWSVEKWEL